MATMHASRANKPKPNSPNCNPTSRRWSRRSTSSPASSGSTKDQVVAQKYDLSASRYRQIEHEEVFYEQPAITLERMRQLEIVAGNELKSLLSSLSQEGESR